MRGAMKSHAVPKESATRARARFVSRIRILCGFFIVAGFFLVGRLYFVQIVHGDEYERSAIGQYVEHSIESEDRGAIFFTAKDGALVSGALMQTGWRIAIVPKDIENAAYVYDRLNAITPIDSERFMTSAARTNDKYEEVAFRLDDATAKKIRALKIPGVLVVGDQWRFYPGGTMAGHVLGFVGYKGQQKIGVYGLEKQWHDTLKEPNAGLYVNPFAEIFANFEAAITLDPTAHQGSIITTIEPAVQHQLELVLQDVMETYTPKFAGGIVMDPHTGEIVAMAQAPTFDPNTYNTVTDVGIFSNQLVEGRYEMGSIIKPLTMAAGIDSGAITPETTYTDTGCIERSDFRVCNFDHKARGKEVPMQQILSQSLNLGVTFIEEKMGSTAFQRYMQAYQLGQKTGIDLPNEVSGNLQSLNKGSAVDYATASFGQGISMSGVETIRALSSLANGGKLPSPHLVKYIKYESGLTRSVPVRDSVAVLKPETAETVTNMLVTVVDKELLKGEIKQEHYSIAAKTGTAQIGIPGGGGYYTDRYLHSFFGYFPAHEPKFIVFLFAVEPHGATYASATLAHPFLDVTKFLINYYNIKPDR